MKKYEVIAPGIYIKDKSGLRQVEVGEVLEFDDVTYIGAKLREVAEAKKEKDFVVASPQEKKK